MRVMNSYSFETAIPDKPDHNPRGLDPGTLTGEGERAKIEGWTHRHAYKKARIRKPESGLLPQPRTSACLLIEHGMGGGVAGLSRSSLGEQSQAVNIQKEGTTLACLWTHWSLIHKPSYWDLKGELCHPVLSLAHIGNTLLISQESDSWSLSYLHQQ